MDSKLFVSLFLAFFMPHFSRSEFNLTIVHIGDFHSHWLEFNDIEKQCSEEESKLGECFGGFPRLLTLVRDIRQKEKHVLVLSSGEFFLARSLNAMHGWKMALQLLPRLGLDAMSLSNHDFGSGLLELSAFLYGLEFPVLCANIAGRGATYLRSRVNASVVLSVGGQRVGVVGYLHADALERSRLAAGVRFVPEIPALREEVDRLTSQGVDKIIALGHSGFYTDMEIARQIEDVDVVVGGNTDVVVEAPDEETWPTLANLVGNYPRVHSRGDEGSERRTLVLHVPQHGKHVGVIRLTFDDWGRVVRESGKPVLLDRSIRQDDEALAFIKETALTLQSLRDDPRIPHEAEELAVATEAIPAGSRRCRTRECELGNLAADAMLAAYDRRGERPTPHAVLFNAGALRYTLPAGPIFIQDVLHSIYSGDIMNVVHMSGEELTNLLEHSVRNYDKYGLSLSGSFLQVAGLRVVYDILQPASHRVRSLSVRSRGFESGFEPVKPYRTYFVAMPQFIARGGDGFPLHEPTRPDNWGHPEFILITEYLKEKGEVTPILDGRISFADGSKADTIAESKNGLINTTNFEKPASTTKRLKMRKRKCCQNKFNYTSKPLMMERKVEKEPSSPLSKQNLKKNDTTLIPKTKGQTNQKTIENELKSSSTFENNYRSKNETALSIHSQSAEVTSVEKELGCSGKIGSEGPKSINASLSSAAFDHSEKYFKTSANESTLPNIVRNSSGQPGKIELYVEKSTKNESVEPAPKVGNASYVDKYLSFQNDSQLNQSGILESSELIAKHFLKRLIEDFGDVPSLQANDLESLTESLKIGMKTLLRNITFFPGSIGESQNQLLGLQNSKLIDIFMSQNIDSAKFSVGKDDDPFVLPDMTAVDYVLDILVDSVVHFFLQKALLKCDNQSMNEDLSTGHQKISDCIKIVMLNKNETSDEILEDVLKIAKAAFDKIWDSPFPPTPAYTLAGDDIMSNEIQDMEETYLSTEKSGKVKKSK